MICLFLSLVGGNGSSKKKKRSPRRMIKKNVGRDDERGGKAGVGTRGKMES